MCDTKLEDIMMSESGQYALRDMIELQMYLAIEPQQKPCPMLPRRTKPLLAGRKPRCNPIEWSAAAELMDGGFIERTSTRTFVVSKYGYEFYRRELKDAKPTS
jgi:hypothetical protein